MWQVAGSSGMWREGVEHQPSSEGLVRTQTEDTLPALPNPTPQCWNPGPSVYKQFHRLVVILSSGEWKLLRS